MRKLIAVTILLAVPLLAYSTTEWIRFMDTELERQDRLEKNPNFEQCLRDRATEDRSAGLSSCMRKYMNDMNSLLDCEVNVTDKIKKKVKADYYVPICEQ